MGGCESKMTNFVLSPKALVMTQGSSIGTQNKYYDDSKWFKLDTVGYEGTAEYLASLVLKYSNVNDYVTYEKCTINGKNGCVSKTFLNENESFISFDRLHQLYKGESLNDVIPLIDTIEERIDYVKDFIKYYTELDISDYLSKILSLDALILNVDRHFHNLGIIVNEKEGKYKVAPIFDNGNSLLSNLSRFPYNNIEDNLEQVIGLPFSSNLELQAVKAGIGLKLDYDGLYNELENEKPSRALNVLLYQLEKEKYLIPDMNGNNEMEKESSKREIRKSKMKL